MRAVKLLLFAVLVAGWWQMWQHRHDVASAYLDERPPLALELNGVGAVPEESDPTPSPFVLLAAGTEQAPTFVEPPSEPDDPAVELTGGAASLQGTVVLPDGTPVAGATVRIERFTSEGSAVGETESGPDGSWEATGLRGGRLRLRAYAPNALASVEPVVLILGVDGDATLSLGVEAASPSIRFDVVGPPGIAVGADGTVAVVASREAVDDSGRLVRFPLAGQTVQFAVDGPARLLSADLVTADAGGAARYLLACDGAGTLSARLLLDTERATVDLPSCMTPEILAELIAAEAQEESADADTPTEVDP